MSAYQGNRQGANDLALEASPVGKVLLDFVATISVWSGTASELLAELDKLAADKTKRFMGWPKTPRAMSGIVKRLAPNLRAMGIDLEFGSEGRGRNKRRRITIEKQAESSVPSVPTAAGKDPCGDGANNTGLAGNDAWAPATIAGTHCGALLGTLGDDGDGNPQLQSRRERVTI